MIINTNLINTAGTLTHRGLYDTEKKLFLFENGWGELEEYIKIDTVPPNAKVVKWDGEAWEIVEEHLIEPIPPQKPTEIELLQQKVAEQEKIIKVLLGTDDKTLMLDKAIETRKQIDASTTF